MIPIWTKKNIGGPVYGQWKTASQHWLALKDTQIQNDQSKCGDCCFPAFPQSRVFVASELEHFSSPKTGARVTCRTLLDSSCGGRQQSFFLKDEGNYSKGNFPGSGINMDQCRQFRTTKMASKRRFWTDALDTHAFGFGCSTRSQAGQTEIKSNGNSSKTTTTRIFLACDRS